MVRVGDELLVTPDGIGRRGEATVEHDGIRLRIRGAIPGEPARVRIRHVSKGGPVAEADFVEAIEPHPLRREVRCPIHDDCGGCGLQHVDGFALKTEQAKKILPGPWGKPIPSPRPFHYRAKTFLLSDGKRFGVRPPRGPELIDTTGCAVLRPEIEEALTIVRTQLDAALVRTVMVRSNRAGEVQVTLVHRGEAPRVDLPFDHFFTQRHDAPGNRICSDEPEVGGDPIREQYGPLSASIPPTAFCQANPDVAEALYLAAATELTGETIAEFYCGAGVAGLLAADRAHLTGIDKSPRAIELARANAAGRNAEFHAVAAEDFPAADWDSVLVNPPRTGCHEAVLEAARSAKRLVYLSCNPVTLARDIQRLGWNCVSLRAADMLPQTPHLEVLAVLEP
ncbi:MAG: class I SAM-dependent RNA methyltransferase [Planctomycetota bacterium]